MCLSVHLGALAIEAHLGTKKSAQGVADLCSASRASSSYKKREAPAGSRRGPPRPSSGLVMILRQPRHVIQSVGRGFHRPARVLKFSKRPVSGFGLRSTRNGPGSRPRHTMIW
jgi:hypothetical protein